MSRKTLDKFLAGLPRLASKLKLGWGLLLAVWIPMVALLLWGRGGVLDLLRINREVASLEAEIATLESRNEGVREEILLLETDPTAYEGPARQVLQRKKKGEVVLYLPPEGSAPAPPPALPTEIAPPLIEPSPDPAASGTPPAPQLEPAETAAQPSAEATAEPAETPAPTAPESRSPPGSP